MRLIDLLRENNIHIALPCGGMGRCGNCRIICSELPVTSRDINVLSEAQIGEGYRLACAAEVEPDFDISLIKIPSDNTFIISDTDCSQNAQKSTEHQASLSSIQAYGIAIDLGTTTIAIALVNKRNGDIIDTITCANPGCSYGADVISRIEASNDGCIKILQEQLRDCINLQADILIQRNKIDVNLLGKIVIAANTTMIHLLMGYPCNGLGRYPFTPHTTNGSVIKAKSLLNREDLPDTDIYIIPMVSAFIGGDIVSGIYSSGIFCDECLSLLIDLGTNGELVIGNKNGLIATSTSAGPAFEAANISIGVPSIPGAINETYLIGRNSINYKTLGGKTPIGICGSGLVSVVSDMLDAKIISSDGTLDDAYFDKGYPIVGNLMLKQKDIRELQLAKSAIRCGIELICDEYGVSSKDIDNIYIAGGFGNGINISKAINIGLIPDSNNTKFVNISNGSLSGAIKCIYRDDVYNEMTEIANGCKTLFIGNSDSFKDKYLTYMAFDNEE